MCASEINQLNTNYHQYRTTKSESLNEADEANNNSGQTNSNKATTNTQTINQLTNDSYKTQPNLNGFKDNTDIFNWLSPRILNN